MGYVTICNHSIWLKHIENAPQIVTKIESLAPNAPITLQIEDKPVIFRKMRDGADGRPTRGIRPDESFKNYWNQLFQRRSGEKVEIKLNEAPIADSYLAAISSLLSEWDSPEDNEAYNDL
jgi:hypothetical protein